MGASEDWIPSPNSNDEISDDGISNLGWGGGGSLGLRDFTGTLSGSVAYRDSNRCKG